MEQVRWAELRRQTKCSTVLAVAHVIATPTIIDISSGERRSGAQVLDLRTSTGVGKMKEAEKRGELVAAYGM